jgi:surface polysaccharide O-acyltransferase-like enzyme
LPSELPYLLLNSGVIGTIKFVLQGFVNEFTLSPLDFIFQGTGEHLWFLTGLLCAVAISSIFVYKCKIKALFLIAVGLYTFGVIAKAYEITPVGVSINFNTRNGPFFSTILFAAGYALSSLKPNQRWLFYGMIIFGVGILMQVVEFHLIWRYYNVKIGADYVFGTFFMGIGAAVAALSNHRFVRSVRLSTIGRYTLGIYVSHNLFASILRPIDGRISHPAWEIGFVFIVLILAIITTYILSKNKYTRKIVM